ncbi:UNVERIFIED_CONTAM: hypothetical protein FKN15_048321 [Acipenser sinensis]
MEEQEKEKRRQVIEKFQKAPFEEIAAQCESKANLLQDKLTQIFELTIRKKKMDKVEEYMERWHDHQRELKEGGASWCLACLEYGHLPDVCPYEDSIFVQAFDRGEVETVEEWIHLKAIPSPQVDQETCLTCLKGEEWRFAIGNVGHKAPDQPPSWQEVELLVLKKGRRGSAKKAKKQAPAPEWEQPERPQPKRGESVHPQSRRGRGQLQQQQQQQEEVGDDGWEVYVINLVAVLSPGCGAYGHMLAICPTQYEEARASSAQKGGARASSARKGGSRASSARKGGSRASSTRKGGARASSARKGGSRASSARKGGARASSSRKGGARASSARKGGARASSARKGGARASSARKGEPMHPAPRKGEPVHPAPGRGGARASSARKGGARASSARKGGARASSARKGGARASSTQKGGARASSARKGGARASSAQKGGARATSARKGGAHRSRT